MKLIVTRLGQLPHMLANSLNRVMQAQCYYFEWLLTLTGALTEMCCWTLTWLYIIRESAFAHQTGFGTYF